MEKVTLAVIAEKAGVAKSTVCLALRNDPRVKKPLRLRIRKMAEKLGYQSNPIVSQLMSELRKSQTKKYQATLACIQVSSFHPSLLNLAAKEWTQGFTERAHSQGYQVDNFWLHETKHSVRQNAEHIYRVMKARNIKGIVFYDIRDNSELVECEALWENFPSVVLGPRLRNPALNFVSSNHFEMAREACNSILEAGYRRIGIVLDYWVDAIMQHQLTGGYLVHKLRHPEWPSILYLPEEPEKNRIKGKQQFREWIERDRPDACLCINQFILDWIIEMGLDVPAKMGVAFVDLNEETRKIAAGMNQQRKEVGINAADILIGKVNRRESGIPAYQSGTSVMAYWVPGPSIRSKLTAS
ncbi:LacI family DNA-binding transcriptional regulator [Puniceicoccus vermicola]|uniref:LacI family DNA-binding transcriptional regulator n=1 Tax=Puniceicoccus vermicola TaxID=388746 RepID=A0A7X1E546_9BACT|nr:LacI family DNA-binding transcriptional regulator [Puniceicoccus vermicola]MBC2602658.1 LacI family DNA-binding transcriptional regulator [Puniceicoccus vermicola]